MVRAAVSSAIAAAIICLVIADASNALAKRSKHATSNRGAGHAGKAHSSAARRGRTKSRASRASAVQEAARLGAMVGNGCNGRAAIQRSEQQWVVLCSNGKTYLVEMPSPQSGDRPAVECSLAGSGGEPACFVW